MFHINSPVVFMDSSDDPYFGLQIVDCGFQLKIPNPKSEIINPQFLSPDS